MVFVVYVQEHPKAQPDQNQQPKGLIRISSQKINITLLRLLGKLNLACKWRQHK